MLDVTAFGEGEQSLTLKLEDAIRRGTQTVARGAPRGVAAAAAAGEAGEGDSAAVPGGDRGGWGGRVQLQRRRAR